MIFFAERAEYLIRCSKGIRQKLNKKGYFNRQKAEKTVAFGLFLCMKEGLGKMTEQQTKQIRKMREQGIGYRSIALSVGLSRDIVRNFCKAKGLSGYGSALTKNIQEQA